MNSQCVSWTSEMREVEIHFAWTAAQSTQSECCVAAGSWIAMTAADTDKPVNCVLLIVVQSLFITETVTGIKN